MKSLVCGTKFKSLNLRAASAHLSLNKISGILVKSIFMPHRGFFSLKIIITKGLQTTDFYNNFPMHLLLSFLNATTNDRKRYPKSVEAQKCVC